MKIRKAFKFQLKPNGQDIRTMRMFCGHARFVFNKALAWQNSKKKEDNTFRFSYSKIANLLPEWKSEHPWLKDCHSQVLQHSLKDLESAYRNFFRQQAKEPKFKKKGEKDSFRFPQGVKLEEHNNRIYLPKIGWISYRNSQKVEGTIKNVSISMKCGMWYASIQTEYLQEHPLREENNPIGIDVGIARLATLSNGKYYDPQNAFKTSQDKLAKLQRKLKNKVKFSKNWTKAKNRISKLHHKIANTRRDYLHKVSTEICKNHAIIYVEDLKISNMSKSAKGSTENPGKNVKAKSGLNKAILDQGWHEFRRQLEYKSLWMGGILQAVPAKNTSRRCPNCNHTDKENRKKQDVFCCVKCNYKENADLVGAINILRVGHTQIAC